MNRNLRITHQCAAAVTPYLNAVKEKTGLSFTQIISQMIIDDMTHDPFRVGGRWSSDRSERKAARKAERAERKAAKPPAQEPQEQEPPKDDDEWTHSEWMQELRRLYIKRADTLQGDELKQFCEACLPKFKVEADARKLLEELKADDW